MAEVDWLALATSVLGEGLKALLPGSAVVVGPAARALEPELRQWRQDKAERQAFARSVGTWAATKGYGEADIDLGMRAARDILGQRAASWEDIARSNLDARAIAAEVLANDPVPQQPLELEARDVCAETITRFYIRLLDKSGLGELSGASLQELLRRADSLEISFRQLRELIAELRDAKERETPAKRRRRQFLEVRDAISDLESAQSDFRWVTRPDSEFEDPASIRQARLRLVPARVALEARAMELSDPELRARVLAFVSADEAEDQALRSGSSDSGAFAAVRLATVQAYRDALNAVSEGLRLLDEPPP
jgi:hypothetical protein